MIRIAIIDDHFLVREGLKKVFVDTDIIVSGEYKDANGFLKNINKLEVDVLLLDISMPDRCGLDIIAEVKKNKPILAILILSMHPEERYAIRSLALGADGYVTKDSDPEILIDAIKKVNAGRKYFSESVVNQLLSNISKNDNIALPHHRLSNREFEVFQSLALGNSVKEIASALCLSISTIHTYKSRIKEKLSLQKDSNLIYYAIQNNLIDK